MSLINDPNSFRTPTTPDYPQILVSEVVGLSSLLANVTGALSDNVRFFSSRAFGFMPIESTLTTGVLPTTGSQSTVYCKRIFSPTLKPIDKVGIQHDATAHSVTGGVQPQIKFALYTLNAQGLPNTKVSGIENTFSVVSGTAYTMSGTGCLTPTALPYVGDYVIAWVTNRFAASGVTSAGTFSATRLLNLGSPAGFNVYPAGWTNRGFNLNAGLATNMFNTQAEFAAFNFPTSFASLNATGFTEIQGAASPAAIDWFWSYSA